MKKTIWTCKVCGDSFEDAIEFEVHLNQHADILSESDWDLDQYEETIEIQEPQTLSNSKEIILKSESAMDRDATKEALEQQSREQLEKRIKAKREELKREGLKVGIKTDRESHSAERDIAKKYTDDFLLTHANVLYGHGYKPLSEKAYKKIMENLSKETKMYLPSSTEDFSEKWDSLEETVRDMVFTDLTEKRVSKPDAEHEDIKGIMEEEEIFNPRATRHQEHTSASEQVRKTEESLSEEERKLGVDLSKVPLFDRKYLIAYLRRKKKEKEELSKQKSWQHG